MDLIIFVLSLVSSFCSMFLIVFLFVNAYLLLPISFLVGALSRPLERVHRSLAFLWLGVAVFVMMAFFEKSEMLLAWKVFQELPDNMMAFVGVATVVNILTIGVSLYQLKKEESGAGPSKRT